MATESVAVDDDEPTWLDSQGLADLRRRRLDQGHCWQLTDSDAASLLNQGKREQRTWFPFWVPQSTDRGHRPPLSTSLHRHRNRLVMCPSPSIAIFLLLLLLLNHPTSATSLRSTSPHLVHLLRKSSQLYGPASSSVQSHLAASIGGGSTLAASSSSANQGHGISSLSNTKLLTGLPPHLKGQSTSSSGSSSSSTSSANAPPPPPAASLDDEPQRWHTVSAYVGGEVSLPCAVDVATCGRIYFITWTKNGTSAASGPGAISAPIPTTSTASVSKSKSGQAATGDWQRVFIHSETFESVLGDLEAGGPPGRVSFGPKEKINSTAFVYLTVKSVTPRDEGVYKCDVTYVRGKCPSLTYTRVQTLVAPSPPKIRVNGQLLSSYRSHSSSASSSSSSSANSLTSPTAHFSSKPPTDIELLRHRQIGPFEEGSTIVFECSTFGGRPLAELRWYNGSRPLRAKLNIIESNGSGPQLPVATDTPDYLMNEILLETNSQRKGLKGDQPSATKRELLVATTRIIASRYDLGAKFECRVHWNNSADSEAVESLWSRPTKVKGHQQNQQQSIANASLLHEWLLLDIKVRPLSIKVESPRSPVVAGETVMLRCQVDGARPAANITWYNRSEAVLAEPLPTPPGALSTLENLEKEILQAEAGSHRRRPARTKVTTELMTDGTYRSTSILVFEATQSDHQADFFCKGSNEVLRNRNEVPLLQGVQLAVLYPPLVAIEPDGIIPVNETSSLQLWCTYDANPPNITEVIWLKNGQRISFDRWNTEKIWTSFDERGTPILTVNDIDRNDSAEYRCRVKNSLGVAESMTSAKLQVAFPPIVQLSILEPPSQTVIESSPTSLLSLRCITIAGNPAQLTTVHWYRNGRHFLSSISLKSLQQQQTQAANQAGGPHFYRVGSGKHYTLLDESTPVGPVNGALLNFSNAGLSASPLVQYLESPDILTITNISRLHAGNYSCVGFNGAASSSERSAEQSITVQYRPGRATLALSNGADYVLDGAQALLECTVADVGNPRASAITWTHNGVPIDRQGEELPAGHGGHRSAMMARLRTAAADKSTGGQYGCLAVNELGEGLPGTLKLDVRAPPKLLTFLPATLGAQLNESITLSCAVECEPQCAIHWYHNNLTLLSAESRGVFASSVRNELRAKLRNGNELPFWIETSEHSSSDGGRYSLTESKLHVLNTSALFDHDQLSCTSAGNSLGPPAKSTLVFRREFAPHSVHISVPQIDLLEGERYPEKPVQCSAFGNPPPNYYWTFSPFHSAPSSPATPAHAEHSAVVAIGPQLTLNMTTMNGRGGAAHVAAKSDARVATEGLSGLFAGALGSTPGPSLFRASRSQSGNYTCVASNRHGTFATSMIINVFYRPECELRRIHTAKLFKQHSSTFPNGSRSTSTHFDSQPTPSHVLISCSASSNPAPMAFSWFRRNGTSGAMTEIHPSPETEHSLFVAVQDYDYDDQQSGRSSGSAHHVPFQSDQQPSYSLGHSRSSAVLSVPESVRLDEYACVVSNLIGKSEACWFEDQPAQGQIAGPEVSSWWWLAEENLFVVAATAGVIVFMVVASAAVAIVVCLHKHRTPSFKGFGTGSSSGSNCGTPQRFKLERPHHLPAHHLLDSSPDMDIDFISGLDNRSKTATLTAGYRMVPSTTGAAAGTAGTMGKNYRTLPHHAAANTYATAGNGSVYGGSSSNGSNGGSRPFLVSYASSNVYAEPDQYHCGASNHSGDQLTGSTTVTNASGGQLVPGSGLGVGPSRGDLEPPSVPKRTNSKYGSSQEIYEGTYGPTYEELDQSGANSRYYYQHKAEVTAQLPPRAPLGTGKAKKAHKKRSKKSRNAARLPGDCSNSSSSVGSSSGDEHDDADGPSTDAAADELTGRRRGPGATKSTTRPTYILPQEPSSDSESTSNSAAYNPERDFYYAPSGPAKIYEHLPPSGASSATNGRIRRALPQSKYGSLIRQSSAGGVHHSPASYHRGTYQPQQFQASPISTRIYFNFNDGSGPPAPVTSNAYNSLRYGSPGANWAANRRGSSPQGPTTMRTFNRNSATQPQQADSAETPPEYHRVFDG